MSDRRYPVSFRFGEREEKDLEITTQYYSQETGVPHNRTDVLRLLLRRDVKRIQEKSQEKQ